MGSWSNLPIDILEQIAERTDHGALLSFGGVCTSWRSIYLANRCRLPENLPVSLCLPRPFGAPMLMQACNKDGDDDTLTWQFSCLVNGKVYGVFHLPEAADKWICGSSFGWLATIDMISGPSIADCTKVIIPDDIAHLGVMNIQRVIITADPVACQDSGIVMAIVGSSRRLLYCSIGDKKWTKVEGSRPYMIDDAVYYNGRFYAVSDFGTLVSFDSGDPNSEIRIEAVEISCPKPELEYLTEADRFYLVVSSGLLLMVGRLLETTPGVDIDGDHYLCFETKRFKIFRLARKESPTDYPVRCSTARRGSLPVKQQVWYTWIGLERLPDQTLFLGRMASWSPPVHDLHRNCTGNRIYFTDDKR